MMKQTEIGLIPDDWEVRTLGDLFEMKAGGDVDKQHFSSYKSDKYTYKIFSNGLENEGIYGYTDLPKYKGDSITITGRGTVGVSMYRKDDFDAVIRLLVLNSKKRNITDNFFISEVINETVKFPNESTGVPQLTVPQIKDVLIPVPPLAEQQRIAKALSDVDTLISTTEKLIQKKKNIKQGTMQNLLTGKKRLPGFAKSTNYKQSELGLIPEDWEVKNLGELFDMKAGGDVDKEHFSYCKSSIYKYKIFSNGLENEGIYGYTDLPKYKGNAITITGRGTVGIAMFREEDFDAVIRLLVLNSKNDNLTNNSYLTEEINSCISSPNESTGVPQLTVPQIRDIVIALPSKEEQTAIANVLSSMDKEIETLNTKLEKYRNLKTAMMQQLLTGKIRLVK